jgi:hypothetical protein
MHDGVDGMFAQNLPQERRIAHIAADKLRRSGHQCPIARAQIVEHDNVLTPHDQRVRGMAANIASSACDQDAHKQIPKKYTAEAPPYDISDLIAGIQQYCVVHLRQMMMVVNSCEVIRDD